MHDSDPAAARDRPNVVMIHCHDLGQYLGCYGHDVETPNIDALAANGALLQNAFCTAPQCSPSRSSLTTGTYPHENGVMGLAHMGWSLDENARTLPRLLGDLGYETHLLGFQHEVPHDVPERIGYDHTNTETKRALELVEVFEEFLDERDDQPFFASVGIEEPHRPFEREYVDDEVYGAAPDPESVEPLPYLPDEPEIREDIATLQAFITGTLDRAVGQMCERLEEAGIAEDTVLVFTTDHGLAMPRAKGTCYDPGLETALLVSWPGVVDDGAEHDELVSNVDFLPTLLDLVGGDPPADVAGESVAPLLRGEPFEGRDRIYGEMTWHDRYNPIRAIRTERYKYVRNFTLSPRVFVPMDVVPTPSGRAVHEEFYVPQRPEEELYDLDADPHEQENLAADRKPFEPSDTGSEPDPEYEAVLEELRSELDSWMAETDDPLLDGPVPYTDVA